MILKNTEEFARDVSKLYYNELYIIAQIISKETKTEISQYLPRQEAK